MRELVYVIAPSARTADYYRQAFGISGGPRVRVMGASAHDAMRLRGIAGRVEIYAVNSDNGEFSEEVLEQLQIIDSLHPGTVEWVGFG